MTKQQAKDGREIEITVDHGYSQLSFFSETPDFSDAWLTEV